MIVLNVNILNFINKLNIYKMLLKKVFSAHKILRIVYLKKLVYNAKVKTELKIYLTVNVKKVIIIQIINQIVCNASSIVVYVKIMKFAINVNMGII